MMNFEPELYAPLETRPYSTLERGEMPTNFLKNSSRRSGNAKKHVGSSSIVSGLFFSGVGYAVGVTGSIIKDVASCVFSEAPNIPSYLSKGLDPNTIQSFYTFVGDTLSQANSYGGVAAALGFFGGAFFMAKLKSSTQTALKVASSIFGKRK